MNGTAHCGRAYDRHRSARTASAGGSAGFLRRDHDDGIGTAEITLYLGAFLPMKRGSEPRRDKAARARARLRRWRAASARRPPAAAGSPGFFVGADEDSLLWGDSQQVASIARAHRAPVDPDHAASGSRANRPSPPRYRRLLNKLSSTLGPSRRRQRDTGRRAGRAAHRRRRAASTASSSPTCLRGNPEINDVVDLERPERRHVLVAPVRRERRRASRRPTTRRCWRPVLGRGARRRARRERGRGRRLEELVDPGRVHARLASARRSGSTSSRAAYRASGRTQPIFDTLRLHPASDRLVRAPVDEASGRLRDLDRRLRRR